MENQKLILVLSPKLFPEVSVNLHSLEIIHSCLSEYSALLKWEKIQREILAQEEKKYIELAKNLFS